MHLIAEANPTVNLALTLAHAPAPLALNAFMNVLVGVSHTEGVFV